MPLLRNLTKDEQDALIHKVLNSNRVKGDSITGEVLNEMINKRIETKLSKISEEENYNAKNRYRLQRKTLDYADKKRMPIDESKLKDVLQNRPTFRARIDKEIGNYYSVSNNPQFENGLLTYLNEAAYGEMRDLIRDVGIHVDNLEFFNVGDLMKHREKSFVHPSD